jgi:hypothetical protein
MDRYGNMDTMFEILAGMILAGIITYGILTIIKKYGG